MKEDLNDRSWPNADVRECPETTHCGHSARETDCL